MTTLRDDGYLETDDPVVAACFIGRQIYRGYHETLKSVTETGVGSIDRAWNYTSCAYPILIPAKTVAEVYDGRVAIMLRVLLNLTEREMRRWLAPHAKEDT